MVGVVDGPTVDVVSTEAGADDVVAEPVVEGSAAGSSNSVVCDESTIVGVASSVSPQDTAPKTNAADITQKNRGCRADRASRFTPPTH